MPPSLPEARAPEPVRIEAPSTPALETKPKKPASPRAQGGAKGRAPKKPAAKADAPGEPKPEKKSEAKKRAANPRKGWWQRAVGK